MVDPDSGDESDESSEWSEGDSVDLRCCPACQQDVYEDAEQCPACGEWLTPDRGRPPRGWLLLVILLIVALCGVLAW